LVAPASTEDTAKFVTLVKSEAERINGFAKQYLNDLRNSLVHYITVLMTQRQELKCGRVDPADCLATTANVRMQWDELSESVVSFDQFCRLNAEAFRKIVKKFDKVAWLLIDSGSFIVFLGFTSRFRFSMVSSGATAARVTCCTPNLASNLLLHYHCVTY
jgi:SPX domain protein involved in polyphosphate accumulation